MATMSTRERIEINQRTPRRLIAVYGTLRQGGGNWSRLLKDKATYLGCYQSANEYTMYSAGGFPIVCDFGDTSIEYEVFEVTDAQVLNRIHGLEGCTGIPDDPRNWYDIQPIETPHGRAYMYVQHEGEGLPVVESGNWKNQ